MYRKNKQASDIDDSCYTRVPKPPLVFGPDSLSLAEISTQFQFPRVIQRDEKTLPAKSSSQSNVDMNQPLLAYCKRSVRKVSARSVLFDPTGRKFAPVGNHVLVPEDYNGWFAVLGHPDHVKTDEPVPHHRVVGSLATSPCSKFLVGGTEIIPARMTGTHNFCVQPGDILRKGSVYSESANSRGVRYLLCYDERDREISIPVTIKGVFYDILQDGGIAKVPILQMTQIISQGQFPILVKLVYGKTPHLPCAFTETLVLTDSRMCHTVVASTLLNFININLELPIGIALRFKIAEDTKTLRDSEAYVRALRTCKDKTSAYMKSIKVIAGKPDPRPADSFFQALLQQLLQEQTKNIRSRSTSDVSTQTCPASSPSLSPQMMSSALPASNLQNAHSTLRECGPPSKPLNTLAEAFEILEPRRQETEGDRHTIISDGSSWDGEKLVVHTSTQKCPSKRPVSEITIFTVPGQPMTKGEHRISPLYSVPFEND